MKSKMTLFSLILALCFVLCVPALAADDSSLDNTLPVFVNEAPSGHSAVVVKGSWYMKLRDICDIYFVDLDYDNTSKTITIYDEPTPTKLKLLGAEVVDNEKMFVKNGSVYVSLQDNGVLTFTGQHKQRGHLDLQRSFSFNNGSWSLNDTCQQVGELQYAVYGRTSHGDATLNDDYVWQFSPNGRCRAVAAYWCNITSFVVDKDNIFIVGRDTWNASSVVKFSLIDGAETRLGQSDFDYGDNLQYALNNRYNIEPLAHSGIVVRDDGVYTVGYSHFGYFENNIIDKDVFADTYSYYRLSKDGETHEKIAEWPE